MKFCKLCGNRLNGHTPCERCNKKDETIFLRNENPSTSRNSDETVLLTNENPSGNRNPDETVLLTNENHLTNPNPNETVLLTNEKSSTNRNPDETVLLTNEKPSASRNPDETVLLTNEKPSASRNPDETVLLTNDAPSTSRNPDETVLLTNDAPSTSRNPDETVLLTNENPLTSRNPDETVLLTNENPLTSRNSDETVLLTNEAPSTSRNPDEMVLLSNVKESISNNQSIDKHVPSLLFNRYQIESVLGKGGMGTVYLVNDLRLKGKLWAIKETMMSPDDYLEFVDEAKMLVDLEHPNLPNIVDYYAPNEKGQTYIVMDYIKGKPLSTLFEESGYSLPYQRIIKYAIQLCNLLDYLHHHKPTPIIYRDLKPANVMIDEKDNVQLIDFGIARKYKEGKNADTVQMGTIGFAAPEQFEQTQTDHRTDLFSLGAMLYYLLSGGRYIYATGQPLHTINHEVPEKLSEIVQKLVKVNPAERYQNTKLLKQDLTKLRVTGILQPEANNQVEKKVKKMKNPSSKKAKVTPLKSKLKVWTYISISFILLGLISFGGYKYLEITNNLEHTVEKFENAVIDQDKAALLKLFTTSDERLDIGEEEVGYFLKYLENNPSKLKPLLLSLKEPLPEEPSEMPFLLKKGGKKLYFIDTYKIEVQPQFLTIQTNQENTIFYIGKKEISRLEKNLSKNIGPLMPGLYQIKAVWETELTSLDEVQTVELFTVEDQMESLSYEFIGTNINIDSNYPEAKLFVNNKDINKMVKNANPFGPIVTNGTMKVFAEFPFPWGNIRSEEVTIESQDNLQLTLNPLTESLKETLVTIANEFAGSYVDAFKSGDVNKLKHLDTPLRSTYNTEIQNNQNNQITWKGALLSAKYERESFEFRVAGVNEYEVTVNSSFQYLLASSSPNNPLAPEIQDFNQQLTYKYNSNTDQWLITNISPSHSLNGGSNIQEFNFADAKKEIQSAYLNGTWSGIFETAQGKTPVSIIFTENTARIMFEATKDYPNVKPGKFDASVEFNEESKEVKIVGTEWINQPEGQELISFIGTLSNGIIKGKVIFKNNRDAGSFEITQQNQ